MERAFWTLQWLDVAHSIFFETRNVEGKMLGISKVYFIHGEQWAGGPKGGKNSIRWPGGYKRYEAWRTGAVIVTDVTQVTGYGGG